MPDLFGKKQLGRATTGGRFYATPTERVEAGAVYFPNESSLLFGVAEYTVEAGNLGAFATEGTFVFDKPSDWLDDLGRKVFYRPSIGEIVNQDKKGDVLIGFQILANVPNDKLGVVLTQGENSVVIIVTSTADSGAGTLRQAIADASDGDVILFDSAVFPSGTTTAILLSSTLNIPKNIEIDGDGRVALDGQNAIRVCTPTASSGKAAHLKGLTIKNGAYSNGAGVLLQYGAPILTDCIIEDCVASASAGGVYCLNSVDATFNNCIIRYNTATSNAGGVYVNNTATLTLNDCAITNNSASNGAGVFVASGTAAVLNHCEIKWNNATNIGGALSTSGGSVAFNNCDVKNNTTDASDQKLRSVVFTGGSVALNNSSIDSLRTYGGMSVNVYGGVSCVDNLWLIAQNGVLAVITITDGAALTITDEATIGAATFASDGRGYLATAAGIDTSAATLNNVVACAYGAGLTSFAINDAGAIWTADDLTTTVLLETRDDGGDWDTLAQAAGGSYVATFGIGTIARAFDGLRFWVAEISAYWQVASFVVANNGGGGAGDAAACWVVDNKTITPNISGV